jgi:hypothetical protein
MDRRIEPRLCRVSKIEAARRQIEAAIWLWFVDSDIVSVHTLASAAHRLLCELASLWGVDAWPSSEAYLPKREQREIFPATDAVQFFRHAKTKETYELSEQWTELYLFDAVIAYSNLAGEEPASALMSTFVVRFGVERQDLFVPDAFTLLERKVNKVFNLERLERLSKMDFLKECLGYLAKPTV